MNRRGFLKLLLASAAAEALAETVDLERLLWVPKPIVTVPAMPGTWASIERSTYAWWRNAPPVDLSELKSHMRQLYDAATALPDLATYPPSVIITDHN